MRMIPLLCFALMLLAIVITGVVWRRDGARPPLHVSIFLVAVLLLLAGVSGTFGQRGW
jgi:NADH:ubiquinone oxidoreductase subunit K